MKLTEEYQKLNETMQNTNLHEKFSATGKIYSEVLTKACRHSSWILQSLGHGLTESRREYRMLRSGWFESHEKMKQSLKETPESK